MPESHINKLAKIDARLQLLNEEINERSNIDGFDFLVEKIESGILDIIQD
jgi:DNA sulfur modification protein DndE